MLSDMLHFTTGTGTQTPGCAINQCMMQCLSVHESMHGLHISSGVNDVELGEELAGTALHIATGACAQHSRLMGFGCTGEVQGRGSGCKGEVLGALEVALYLLDIKLVLSPLIGAQSCQPSIASRGGTLHSTFCLGHFV